MRFAIFPSHLSKVPHLSQKGKARSTVGSAAPVTQNHLSKPEDLMLQNATPCRKSASGPSGPPNISEGNISSSAPATQNTSLQILFKRPTHAVIFAIATTP